MISVGIARYFTNVRKGASMPDSTAIRTFWGFPMGVNTEPTVSENISRSTIASGSTPAE